MSDQSEKKLQYILERKNPRVITLVYIKFWLMYSYVTESHDNDIYLNLTQLLNIWLN
jgi:hypothetical protein